MKKPIILSLLFLTCLFQVNAQVCSLDTFTIPGIYPDTIVNLPKGYANSAYGTVIQIRVFTDTMSTGGNVHVTDITVNSVTGMPPGFTYACNPANCAFPGGGNGCIWLSGNPTLANIGTYNLVVNVTLHGKLLNVIPVSQASQILGYKISILGPPVANFAGSASQVCKGGTVTYSDLSTNSPTSWNWTFPGGIPSSSTLQNPVVTYNSSGTYNAILSATNPAGTNSMTKSSFIQVNNLPAASFNASGSLTICQGSSVQFTANSGSGLSYQWIKNGTAVSGATAINFQASTAGTYKVEVTNATGCTKTSGTKKVVVSTLQAVVTAGGSTTFCSGGSVLLSANTGSGLTYQWKKNGTDIPGETNSNYTAKTRGVLKVIVTNSNGCSKASNSTTVLVNSISASFTASGPLTFCSGGSVLFTANNGPNQTYQWKRNGNNINGATQNTYLATTAGTYKVVVTKTNGCSKTSGSKTVIINCKVTMNEDAITETSGAVLYPNPTSGNATLSFELAEESEAVIRVLDMQGRSISEEITSRLSAGEHASILATSGLNPGFYLVILQAGKKQQTLKLIINKQ